MIDSSSPQKNQLGGHWHGHLQQAYNAWAVGGGRDGKECGHTPRKIFAVFKPRLKLSSNSHSPTSIFDT
jgi:hypothetical protein